jgi:hypothetical protein
VIKTRLVCDLVSFIKKQMVFIKSASNSLNPTKTVIDNASKTIGERIDEFISFPDTTPEQCSSLVQSINECERKLGEEKQKLNTKISTAHNLIWIQDAIEKLSKITEDSMTKAEIKKAKWGETLSDHDKVEFIKEAEKSIHLKNLTKKLIHFGDLYKVDNSQDSLEENQQIVMEVQWHINPTTRPSSAHISGQSSSQISPEGFAGHQPQISPDGHQQIRSIGQQQISPDRTWPNVTLITNSFEGFNIGRK